MTRKDPLVAEIVLDATDVEGVADTTSLELWIDGALRGTQPVTQPLFTLGRMKAGAHSAYAVAVRVDGTRDTGATTTFDVGGAPVETRVEVRTTVTTTSVISN